MFKSIKAWWQPEFVFKPYPADIIREFALARTVHLADSPKLMSDQAISIAKWLVASLLILNGGASIATLNAAAHIRSPEIPAVLFLVGILAALLNGWLIQATVPIQSKLLLDLHVYWSIVAANGKQNPEWEHLLWAQHRKAAILTHSVQIPGWLSVVAFIWGYWALMVGYHT